MKSLTLITGVAGLVLVLASTALANDTASVTPAKKDSGHLIPPAAKDAAPHRVSPPPVSKPNLPIDAGRKRGAANIGGSSVTSGHKDGILNGTEVKRHP